MIGLFLAAGSAVFGVGVSYAQGRTSAAQARLDGKRLAQDHLYNARLDEINAEEALRRGMVRSRMIRREGSELVGSAVALEGDSGSISDGVVRSYHLRLANDALLDAYAETWLDYASFEGSRRQNLMGAQQAIIDGNTGAAIARRDGRLGVIGSALTGGSAIAGAYFDRQDRRIKR